MIGPLLARKDLSEMLRDEEFQLWVGILIVTLLIGAVLFSLLDRWRKRRNLPVDDVNVLSSYRTMYEKGELSQEEYEKIRNRVAEKMKGKPRSPIAKVKPPDPPEPSPPASGESSPNSA